MRHHHYTEEEMADPEGWEWVESPQKWITGDNKYNKMKYNRKEDNMYKKWGNKAYKNDMKYHKMKDMDSYQNYKSLDDQERKNMWYNVMNKEMYY